MSLKDDIRIDESAIDIEILQQSELMLEYLHIEADARNDLDRAEDELDVISVELDRDIRRNPEKYEVEKITEPVVSATIKLQKKYSKAHDKALNCKHEYNSAKSAVRAIEVKKTMLENLVKLHGQSYFAGPSVPRDLQAENAKKQRKSNEKIKLKRNKKKDK